jgi:hypothetical protein
MKKVMVLVVFFVLTGTVAFAQISKFKVSAGAGGSFSANLGGGLEQYSFWEDKITTKTLGGGGFIFFDATFVELAAGFSMGSFTQKAESILMPNAQQYENTFTALDFSLLLKLPFNLSRSGQLKLFPLLGVGYRLFLSVGDFRRSDSLDLLDEWLIQTGVGMDLLFTDSWFLRGELLLGFRLPTKYERDMKEVVSSSGESAAYLLGIGPTVKIAIGYAF